MSAQDACGAHGGARAPAPPAADRAADRPTAEHGAFVGRTDPAPLRAGSIDAVGAQVADRPLETQSPRRDDPPRHLEASPVRAGRPPRHWRPEGRLLAQGGLGLPAHLCRCRFTAGQHRDPALRRSAGHDRLPSQSPRLAEPAWRRVGRMGHDRQRSAYHSRLFAAALKQAGARHV